MKSYEVRCQEESNVKGRANSAYIRPWQWVIKLLLTTLVRAFPSLSGKIKKRACVRAVLCLSPAQAYSFL